MSDLDSYIGVKKVGSMLISLSLFIYVNLSTLFSLGKSIHRHD